MFKKDKNSTKCEDCKKYQDQAFELEVDEDLQQERLTAFWQKYRFFVYGAIILILVATAGIQIYQSQRDKIRLAESDAFETAVIQIFSQKPNEAKPVLTDLAQNGRTGYKYLAQLELAGLAARQNDVTTALAELKKLMDGNAPKTLKNAALLSYVGYQADSGDPKELLKMLEPLMDNPAFIGTTMQLATILYLRDHQSDMAKKALHNALALKNLSDKAQEEIKVLIQMVENN